MASKAKFTIKTKKEIYERDNGTCIICPYPADDCHHAKFGQETNYGPDRNYPNEGCLLCRDCHNKAHGCHRGEGIREECIKYCEGL